MAKGDIDFSNLFDRRADYKTAKDYRDAIVEVLKSRDKLGIYLIVLSLGFNSIEEFYNYKIEEPDFKAVRDVFIDNMPNDLKEYLYASLNNKKIRANSSLSKEQRRVKNNLKSRLRVAVKGKLNTDNFYDTFGYSQSDLVKHLESFFNEDISWDNYGQFGWHIDHIKPCSAFDWTKDIEKTTKECFALSNLRPLNWRENIMKGNKYECA